MGGIIMTREQLFKGVELSKEISNLEEQLSTWKRANRFSDNEARLIDDKGYRCTTTTIYVDFNVLKTLTISNIEKKLNELKDEFQKL